MFNFFKKTDSQIQKDVMNELNWDPSVISTQINASVSDGIVTLSGSVPHYSEKSFAEKAAERVGGVKAVADELEVNLLSDFQRDDEDIARTALNALDWNYEVPEGIKVSVEKGWLTLRGEVEWDYQRNAAREAVRSLMGVCNVTNNITIKAKSVQSSDVKNRIEEALKRSAETEGSKIHVAIDGSQVTLSGNVHSLSEIEDARFAAWSAPGVITVKDNLKIAA